MRPVVVVTAEEMRAIDKRAVSELGIPSLVLMENAGVAVVRELEQEFGGLEGKRCLILVGRGNNGGDGLVIARHLLNRHVKVKVFLIAEERELSQDCRFNLEIFRRLEGEIHSLSEPVLSKLKINLALNDLVIDALVGTGFSSEQKGVLPEVIEIVNNCRTPVVSVDVPSGVDPTTGAVQGDAVRATLTVALGFLKTGLLLYPGREHCGKLRVVDIGIPTSLAGGIKRRLTTGQITRELPVRPGWGHKGTFGHCLVVAGSKPMTGAAYLTSHALLRAGAGLVTLAVPESIRDQFPPSEVITVPVSESGAGCFGASSIEQLLKNMEKKDVLVIGPGLGSDPELADVVRALLENWQGPLVLDADGLNQIRDRAWLQELPEETRRKWVFTPHPGELARLLKKSAAEINANRMETAWTAYQELGVNLVLKGAPTISAGSGRMYINSTGNPAMGTAGMGDVLTGIIGGLLAQGMEPFLAAAAGVYVHGKAGDYLSRKYGDRGIIASDMLEVIPAMLSPEDTHSEILRAVGSELE
jgi:NAD(P)H-hydrate epimerase